MPSTTIPYSQAPATLNSILESFFKEQIDLWDKLPPDSRPNWFLFRTELVRNITSVNSYLDQTKMFEVFDAVTKKEEV